MKHIFLFILLLTHLLFAQEQLEKTYPSCEVHLS